VAPSRRKKADDSLLMALACGATATQAAEKAGMSRRTLYRRLEDPAFRHQVSATRADMVQRSAAMLTAASLESVKTLVSLQNSNMPATVRLGAARAILELAGHWREAAELEERLHALEQKLETRAG